MSDAVFVWTFDLVGVLGFGFELGWMVTIYVLGCLMIHVVYVGAVWVSYTSGIGIGILSCRVIRMFVVQLTFSECNEHVFSRNSFFLLYSSELPLLYLTKSYHFLQVFP